MQGRATNIKHLLSKSNEACDAAGGMQSGARHVPLRYTLTQRRLMPSISCHESAPSVPCGVKVGLCSAYEAGGAMGTMTTHMVECTCEGCCSYSTRSAPYCRPDLGIHPCRSSRAGCHTQLTVLSAVGVMGSHMCRQMKLTLHTQDVHLQTMRKSRNLPPAGIGRQGFLRISSVRNQGWFSKSQRCMFC